MENMYLITGVTGLVGKHAVETLLHEKVPASNILGVSRHATQDLSLQQYGIQLMDLDITNKKDYQQLPGGIDTVLHIAAYTDNTPKSLVEAVNHHGTVLLAKWAQNNEVKRFGFVSSVSVYGLHHPSPVSENTPKKPDRFYGWTKLRAEQSLLNLNSDYHLIILRPPYITGKHDSKFVGKFVDRIIKNKLPTIGTGNNSLSFIHAKDVTYGFLDLFKHTTENDVYNIISFNTSFNEFFQSLAEGLGYPYPQKQYPYWIGYMIGLLTELSLKLRGKDTGTNVSRYRIKSFFTDRVFDTSKITDKGFQPRFTFKNTMEELLSYFKKNII